MNSAVNFAEKLKRQRDRIREQKATSTKPIKQKLPETLQEFIPALSPKFSSPIHLKNITDRLDQIKVLNAKQRTEALAKGEQVPDPVHLAFSLPPQHQKTQTVLHLMAKLLSEDQSLNILYITYNQIKANIEARNVQEYAVKAGVIPDPRMQNLATWITMEKGGLYCRGIDGGITGVAADVVVVDDLFKGRRDYLSKEARDKAWEILQEAYYDRTHEGSSVIMFFTRWGSDDAIARARKNNMHFEFMRIPALADHLDFEGKNPAPDLAYPPRELGEALLPQQTSKESLEKMRDNPATAWRFKTVNQGIPSDELTKIFKDPTYYDSAPIDGIRVAFGMDGAYTEKKKNDRSALVGVIYHIETDITYVESCHAAHKTTDQFFPDVAARASRFPILWRGSGVERGTADLARANYGLNLEFEVMLNDKIAANTVLAERWNDGKVRVKRGSEWLLDLLNEVLEFTGAQGFPDDIVDALGSADKQARGGGGLKMEWT